MKKLFVLFAFVFTLFGITTNAHAVDYPFSLTTTSTNSFQFILSAQGTFYVDCGSGGTLSGTGVSGGTITKSDTSKYTYTCSYSSTSVKTIRFGGAATKYDATSSIFGNSAITTISFNISDYSTDSNVRKISSISGNLSAIFPYLGYQSSGLSPRFKDTFYASYITSIPATLFANYTGNLPGANGMFFGTFRKCTNLTSIPSNLFSNITQGGEYIFGYTFGENTGLTYITPNMFSGLIGVSRYMFYYTFYDCTNLTGYIPPSTFAGLIKYSLNTNYMWYITFKNTNLLTSCPTGTHQYTTGYEGTDTYYYKKWNGPVSCEPDTGTTTVNITFDGGSATSCTYGGTFNVPPAPTPPTGYRFKGWKVKTVTP